MNMEVKLHKCSQVNELDVRNLKTDPIITKSTASNYHGL